MEIRIIKQHEMAANLEIPRTLIVAPRQSGKTSAIKKILTKDDIVLVRNSVRKKEDYDNAPNVHISTDLVSIDMQNKRIFVDDYDWHPAEVNFSNMNITSATRSSLSLNFDMIQQEEMKLLFDQICIVNYR